MASADFKNKVEQFRLHYKEKYGVELDDEVLYFYIRINEMQTALAKQIKAIPEVRFKSGWDYFWYGLGKGLWIIPAILLFIIIFLFRK